MHSKLLQKLIVIAALSLVMLFFDAGKLFSGERASFEDLQVGQAVSVEGRYLGAKAILASEIKIDDEPIDQEKLKGKIQTIDDKEKSMRITDVKVLVTPDTLIEDRDIEDPNGDEDAEIEGSPIEFSALRKGWRVKVKGRLQEDDVFTAEQIKVRKPKRSNEIEIESTVQAIDEAQNTLTVMGFTARVNQRTEIEFD